MRAVGKAMPRLFRALVIVGALLLTLATPTAAQGTNRCPPGQVPHYTAGFADLKAYIGAPMGNPVTCEYPDPKGTGDVHQQTTTGLAFWRKATNTPTFTNGFDHWGHTPAGWVTWTGSSIDPPVQAMKPAAPVASGPAYRGQAPTLCDWGDTGGRRAYLCIYPDGSSAMWPAPADQTLLAYRNGSTGQVEFTTAGLTFFGMSQVPVPAPAPAPAAPAPVAPASGTTEPVIVVQEADYLNDHYIIQRRNGEQYLIEKGIGCLGLSRYVGRTVYVYSPGFFAGIGSKLILPNDEGECRIWDSSEL